MKCSRQMILVLLFGAISFVATGNADVDSVDYKDARSDSLLLKQLLNQADSLQRKGFHERSYRLADSALTIAQVTGDRRMEAKSLQFLGVAAASGGNLPKALNFQFRALQISEELKDEQGIATTLNSLGVIYYTKSAYPKALEFLLKGLTIATRIKDTAQIMTTLHNLGLVEMQKGDTAQSLDYYRTAYKYGLILNDKRSLALLNNAFGNYYMSVNEFESALMHYSQALARFGEVGDVVGVSRAYNNIGLLYCNMGEFSKSEKNLEESLQLKIKIDDQRGLASIYHSLGYLYQHKGEYAKSIEWGLRSYHKSRTLGAMRTTELAASLLAESYEKSGNLSSAIEYLKISRNIHDSIFSNDNSRKMLEAEMMRREEIKQFEKRIEQEKREIIDLERNNQLVLVRNFFVVLSLLIILLAASMILYYRRKMKASRLLELQYAEIEKQKEEIAAQRDEIEDQRNALADLAWELQQKNEETTIHRDDLWVQRDLLTAQKKEITDSIEYAKRIQSAALPSLEVFKQVFPESFILYLPKSIVGGDFYWVATIGKYKVLAVGDCTGHGVPGGFMSMLGIALLNEIVKREEVRSASKVLDELRDYLIASLQPSQDVSDPSDGMDLVVAIFDEEENTMQFASANMTFYLIRKDEAGIPRLKDFFPDRMPIGNYQVMKPFTNNSIDLLPGDVFYFFSDGFPDQFGGTEEKKLCPGRFKQMLLSFYDRPIVEQGELLGDSFDRWKGGKVQIDDVLVVGIQV